MPSRGRGISAALFTSFIVAASTSCNASDPKPPASGRTFQREFRTWISERYTVGLDAGLRWHGYTVTCEAPPSRSADVYEVTVMLLADDASNSQVTTAEFDRLEDGGFACRSKKPSASELWTAEELRDLTPCEVVTELCTKGALAASPTSDGNTAPDDRVALPEDAEQRPEGRLPPRGEGCSESDADSACPTCDLVHESIAEVPARLEYLGIAANAYVLGEIEEDADDPELPGTVLVVEPRNAAMLRTVLEGDFETFHDKTRRTAKKRKLTLEQLRAEFDNLRVGLMGHMWCDGDRSVDSPSRTTSRSRIGFAFTGKRVSFARTKTLEDAYAWSWPPTFKPLGYTALGDHEQLLQKVFEEGNAWSGGRGRGYVVLRASADEMIGLRSRVRTAIADFIFVLDMSCGLHQPCHVSGLEYPTLVLRDAKTKKVFLTQAGFTAD